MPTLLLLNGPPASGKSTLARRLASTRPFALALDIDVLRGQIGGWVDDPDGAGFAARDIAIATCRTHLTAGFDVVVPQFLGRAEFIDRLTAVAAETGAQFVEVALRLPRSDAIAAFAARRAIPTDRTHLDAAALIDRSGSDDPVGQMYDSLQLLLEHRPEAIQIDVVRGDVDSSFQRLIGTLRTAGAPWCTNDTDLPSLRFEHVSK